MRSLKFRIEPRRRKFVRLIGRIQDELQRVFAEEQEENGLTKADLARRLGRDKGFITRKLTGTGNMTLETLADLAWALNREIDFRLSKPEELLGYLPNEAGNAAEVLDHLNEPSRSGNFGQRPASYKRERSIA